MSVKVQPVALGLCGTCQHGHVFREAGRERILCNGNYSETLEIRGLVDECTRYYHKGQTSRGDFEEIAWILRTDKSGRIMGFKGPKKED